MTLALERPTTLINAATQTVAELQDRPKQKRLSAKWEVVDGRLICTWTLS